MLQRLTRYWWLIALRGLISLIFAAIAFINPTLAFEALIFALGIFLSVPSFLLTFYLTSVRDKKG